MQRKVIFIILILSSAVLLWQLFRIYDRNITTKEDKVTLVGLAKKLSLGDAKDSVEAVFIKMKTKHLRLHKFSDTLWVAQTPSEPFGNAWMLYVIFDESKRVKALKMRSDEGPESRQPEMPVDRR